MYENVHLCMILRCSRKCRKNNSCNYFTYNTKEKSCYLYDKCPAKKSYGDGKHGVVTYKLGVCSNQKAHKYMCFLKV